MGSPDQPDPVMFAEARLDELEVTAKAAADRVGSPEWREAETPDGRTVVMMGDVEHGTQPSGPDARTITGMSLPDDPVTPGYADRVVPADALANCEAPANPVRNEHSRTGPGNTDSTVLELEFGALETEFRKFLAQSEIAKPLGERKFITRPYPLMRYGPRVTPAWWDSPEREAWLDAEPLLRSHLLSRYNPGGGAHDGMWVYIIASAPAWAALASVLKAYINRHIGRKVVIYGKDGTKLLEVTGDFTEEQIEALLRARVAPPELGGTTSDTGEPPALSGGPAS